ncbi:hypothetical protein SAMN05444920_107432 [Nonomuraea solani]|uniref:Uncharacterized protein n=1 Tax=Nonomuraea solani TaxID=1144553 RepID=A0A1H6E577_9ACTN|nr:hypothetical protein [Nonomuraea solani]SEG92035.1 hypothetical protein SAMN05444920_107432 [Nonomuraea solani]
MSADQPATCPACQGVLVVLRTSAYTPERARLIVANGFCKGRCAELEAGEPTRAIIPVAVS